MVTPTVARIESYCGTHGILIPDGFYRHPAGRYVVIRLDSNPPKLIAKSWSGMAVLVHYLNGMSAVELMSVL